MVLELHCSAKEATERPLTSKNKALGGLIVLIVMIDCSEMFSIGRMQLIEQCHGLRAFLNALARTLQRPFP